MKSALETLGVPKRLVQYERSAHPNDFSGILALAEATFKKAAARYHPDLNPDSEANDLYIELTRAMERLRNPDGMEAAILLYLGEEERQQGIRRQDAHRERVHEKKSLEATRGLLKNINQFTVFGITRPTSFLLQFGASRAILDVTTHTMAVLYLTSLDLEVLPEQTEKAEYVKGVWREQYFDGRKEAWLQHKAVLNSRVTVIGFIPSRALRHQTDENFRIVSDRSELGEGFSGLHMTPAWTAESEAWFVPHLEPVFKKGSEVVVRNRNGFLSSIGSVQAQAPFSKKQ